MFVVKKGSSRRVYLIPSLGIAIKDPMIMLWPFLKSFYEIFLRDFSKNPKLAQVYLKLLFRMNNINSPFSGGWYLFRGIVENWMEFLFFIKNRNNTFLMPVYFSFFGFINICPLGKEFENGLGFENAKKLWAELYTVTNGDILRDGHHFENTGNFCIYKGKLKMCDYGGIRVRQIITRHILVLNELSETFQN